MRKDVPKNLDKKIFSHTAQHSKRINTNPTLYRGGIRL